MKTNHLRFEPVLPPDTRISGNFWKSRETSRDSQRLRRILLGALATELALGRIVFFHVDADATWTPSQKKGCENQEHWRRFCDDVLALWTESKHGTVPRDQAALEQVLILAMPFFELESWAFANIRRLREILRDPKDLAALELWEGDLAALDEILAIKEVLTVRDAHNDELVKHGFPAAALDEVGKSYSDTVARLRASEVVSRGPSEAASRPF